MRNTLYMAHYGKDSKRLLIRIRTGYGTYLRNLASIGTPAEIMEYVNSISVKMDVETILGLELDADDATLLLRTPEENTGLDREFGMAHMIARNLQNHRASLRTILRQHRLAELPGMLATMAVEVEGFRA